ncbi:MFS transporter [Phytoactinopolyspora halotolerans]|uniref:MFS transporter n=1 Tax=Phytoactinopolyspora halotolerans TaxID=1981512 RepID=A0A6L9SBF2_9ACTN|nr:MFS transporter [Phytoactinopolyspora halotolerans]NEE01838.1 MFS transporter [Phytoactinopolyspora halotolerans]
MASATSAQTRSASGRITLGVAAAGTSSFALLYAPQPVLAQLAAEYRLDPATASLAVSVATGALALAVLPIALLSETVGRHRTIVISLLASLVTSMVQPLAPTYAVLLVLRAVQGAAIAGVAGVGAAYLVERLGRSGVAVAVGAMIAGNTIGGMLGRLSVGFSADLLGWRGAFGVVAGVAAGCTALSLASLPRPTTEGRTPMSQRGEPASGPRRPHPRSHLLRALGTALRTPVLLLQYAVAFVGMGAFVAMYNTIGFRLIEQPFALSAAAVSLLFLCYALGAASSVTAGMLVGRVGRRPALAGALLTMAGGAALTLPDALACVVAGFALLTVGFFAAHSVANGWAAAAAPERARGQVSGVYTTSYYLGSSVLGTAGSAVFAHGGWGWLISAVIVVVAGLGTVVAAVAVVAARSSARP